MYICSFIKCKIIHTVPTSPAGAQIKSIFVRKGHAIYHFYKLFKLISTM